MLGFIYFIDVSETLLAIGRISSPTRDYTLCYRGNFTALLSLIFVPNFSRIEAQQQANTEINNTQRLFRCNIPIRVPTPSSLLEKN